MSEVAAVSTAAFDDEVLAANTPVLVKFGAPWCPPCRRIGPEVDAVAAQVAGKARVLSVDVDTDPDVANRYGIQNIPTLLVFKEGQVVAQVHGFAPRTKIA